MQFIRWFCRHFHGEQGRRSGGSTRLPPMWPGFDSRSRCHMWIEFVVGSRSCSEGFSPGFFRFSYPNKPTFPDSNSTCLWSAFDYIHIENALYTCKIIIKLLIITNGSVIGWGGDALVPYEKCPKFACSRKFLCLYYFVCLSAHPPPDRSIFFISSGLATSFVGHRRCWCLTTDLVCGQNHSSWDRNHRNWGRVGKLCPAPVTWKCYVGTVCRTCARPSLQPKPS